MIASKNPAKKKGMKEITKNGILEMKKERVVTKIIKKVTDKANKLPYRESML
jgi:hypothetical protein